MFLKKLIWFSLFLLLFPNCSSSAYAVQYNVTDHLGNLRVSFSGMTCLQENSYSPYGTQSVSNLYSGQPKNNYLFNGKEQQTEIAGFGFYNYGARFYDPALGRWHSIDPLAEERYSLSPYSYCSNNPLSRIDPNGMLDGDYYDKYGNWLYNDGIDDDKVYEVRQIPGIDSEIAGSGVSFTKYVGQVKDVKMTFTGKANDDNPKQGDGQLNVIQEVDNGKEYTRGSFDAVGGPWGNGCPENGEYIANTLRDRGPSGEYNKGMTVDGIDNNKDCHYLIFCYAANRALLSKNYSE